MSKLILLLDTGTSSLVRRTAARQLAEVSLKRFSSLPPDDAWDDALETISKLLPLLKSKSFQTRTAAAHALGLIAQTLPEWHGSPPDEECPIPVDSDLSPFNVASVVATGELLLASAGREYVAKLNPTDRAKRRKAMMGAVGLDGGLGIGSDMDKVLDDADDKDDLKPGTSASLPSTPNTKTPPRQTGSETPKDIFEGLSARQITMIKRKKGNMVEEANKMRRLNAQKAGGGGSETPTPATTPKSTPPPEVKNEPGVKNESGEPTDGNPGAVVIDPGAKKGGAVEPHETKTLKLDAHGHNPWSAVAVELAGLLTDAAWERRHGAASGLMEVLRSTGKTIGAGYPGFLTALAHTLLTLLTLDRFGDFVGDIVMAPVREMAAQALGVLFKCDTGDMTLDSHSALVDMVKQPWAKRWKEAEGRPRGERFSWELRHAGLLGLKYEVAVREPADIVDDVVTCALIALQDQDDDVRTVAATALLPICSVLVTHPQLGVIVETLWNCLGEGTDELGSSTGAVMDLLGSLITYPEVISLMAASPDARALISRIYAFIRHPITSVRLAVVKALLVLVTVPGLPRHDWARADVFSLLFQNLILEDRQEIRTVSFEAFAAALAETNLDETVGPSIEDWYAIAMTPMGTPLDQSLFVGRRVRGHDVDKAMFAADMALITTELVLETRITAAKALALIRKYPHTFDDRAFIGGYLGSGSAHQVFLSSTVIREWAADNATEAAEFGPTLIQLLAPRATYLEMSTMLTRVHAEVKALFQAFTSEGKVKKDRIPELPARVDVLGGADAFSIDTAKRAVGPTFDALTRLLKGASAKMALASLRDRQRTCLASIGYFSAMKERLDIQVAAGVSGALIATSVMPPKLGGVIKAVMDAIKKEESELLQDRAATSVADLIGYCCGPKFTAPVNPTDKVVKNLFTFLNIDTSVTPVFTTSTDGILSLKDATPPPPTGPGRKSAAAAVPEETEEQIAQRVTRRGALAALAALAKLCGPALFETVPRFWIGVSQPLSVVSGSSDSLDQVLSSEKGSGQELVDNLTSLRLTAPTIDEALRDQIVGLFPHLVVALQSSFTVVRNAAARTIAAISDVATESAMRLVVDQVIPLIGDASRVHSRRGAVEAVLHIIKLLDVKALPYVLFLIVPVLGRMSDSDESVRLLATSTFAALVKMVPLEAGIPDPPGFSAELLAKRDEERKFLAQLLDGSRAEEYKLPIEIKAELRQYQKDGVSWLAFLAKYQLHGILCDDMGLGKSLQTICIVGSGHHERATRYNATGGVDSQHLPSLIVCPPTLTGHWYHEILKFTDYLRPIQYVGNAAQRAALRPSLGHYDVVIASYESVRNDIADLSRINFFYCVLDEGHIIKNAKTKISQAVKQIKAQHRLLLSGTPIQNNVLELWNLFDFLMPGFLGTERAFNDRFSKPILADRDGKAQPKEREAAAVALEALHKQVLPFLLRRLKEDVLDDLPPKIIQDYYVDLGDVQTALYDEFSRSRAAEEVGEVLAGDAGAVAQQHTFQSLQYLRKLCNHPALVINDQAALASVEAKLGYAPDLSDLSQAPKLEALQQLLTDCGIGLPAAAKQEPAHDFTGGHRVLIFCQLRSMLDIIERDLFGRYMPTVSYMRLDGDTNPTKRHAVVQTFNDDPKIDVLLLTTSVGGLGLNLTGADTVIFVDHDWNPMKDLQAMDRAHRLGQKRVVNVYRLITKGTLEEKIMGLQRFKLNIASSVVTQQNAGLGTMNTGEVLDLFKVSADGDTKPKASKPSTGQMSMSKMLEGLEELPPEDEYAEMSLDNFLAKTS